MQQGVHDLSHSQLLVLFLLIVYSFSIIGCKEYSQYEWHYVTKTWMTLSKTLRNLAFYEEGKHLCDDYTTDTWCVCVCVCVCYLLSHVQFFATQWTIVWWTPLSVEFSRQEYWNGLPFPSPQILGKLGK